MKQIFLAPIVVSLAALAIVYLWGGLAAFALAAALAILEITFSFDNAVINAKILERMPPRWQGRFLTWGMLISVLGVRVLLPIFIVSAVSFASPLLITDLALFHPVAYAALIATSKDAIDSFGGIFLFLVACGFFFDQQKKLHWLSPVERHLARFENAAILQIVLALALLLLVSHYAAQTELVLVSGLVGIVLFLLMQSLINALGGRASGMRSGLALFLYINVLDAAFSLDGVVGAFAVTTLVPIIFIGLGIGAYFVRAMTMLLAQGGHLRKLIYMEHGAHWAIFTLGILMLCSLLVAIPNWFVACAGLVVIVLAFLSSQRALRRTL